MPNQNGFHCFPLNTLNSHRAIEQQAMDRNLECACAFIEVNLSSIFYCHDYVTKIDLCYNLVL